MKRNEFLKEMGSSLNKTLKAIYHPFAEDDVEKISNVADKAIGIRWHYLSSSVELTNGFEQRYISGKPVLIVSIDRNIRAFSSVCPVCSNLLAFSALYSTGKCFICEKEFNILNQEDVLEFNEFPVKEDKGRIFIGFTN